MNWQEFRSERQRRGRPFVVAHRGVPVLEPENTLPSFALALQQGADVLETDLRFTRDDQIVLFHDSTLERTTNGQGSVRDHTLQELQQLQTRAPSGALTAARIPTLSQLIEATNSQTPLLLELKDPLFADPSYARQLVDLLAHYGVLHSSAIISFQAAYVATVKAVEPAIPTGIITMRNPLPTGRAELLGPVWPLLYLNPLYVAWAHARGKVVAPLDPQPESRMGYYLRLGVDAVLADNPATVLAAIERNQGQAQ